MTIVTAFVATNAVLLVADRRVTRLDLVTGKWLIAEEEKARQVSDLVVGGAAGAKPIAWSTLDAVVQAAPAAAPLDEVRTAVYSASPKDLAKFEAIMPLEQRGASHTVLVAGFCAGVQSPQAWVHEVKGARQAWAGPWTPGEAITIGVSMADDLQNRIAVAKSSGLLQGDVYAGQVVERAMARNRGIGFPADLLLLSRAGIVRKTISGPVSASESDPAFDFRWHNGALTLG